MTETSNSKRFKGRCPVHIFGVWGILESSIKKISPFFDSNWSKKNHGKDLRFLCLIKRVELSRQMVTRVVDVTPHSSHYVYNERPSDGLTKSFVKGYVPTVTVYLYIWVSPDDLS